jgi:hypothetical protein
MEPNRSPWKVGQGDRVKNFTDESTGYSSSYLGEVWECEAQWGAERPHCASHR